MWLELELLSLIMKLSSTLIDIGEVALQNTFTNLSAGSNMRMCCTPQLSNIRSCQAVSYFKHLVHLLQTDFCGCSDKEQSYFIAVWITHSHSSTID